MATVPRRFLTAEEYLEAEGKAEYKSEFVNGEVFAKAGASPAHVLAAMNVGAEIRAQVRRRCPVYGSDMRVHVPAARLYTYPDVSVTCEKPQFADGVPPSLLNPKLIVEVLSPSREQWDRVVKFRYYQAIPSLEQYLLVSSQRPLLELFTKSEQGVWTLSEAQGLEATMELTSVGVKLALADVYELIEFA